MLKLAEQRVKDINFQCGNCATCNLLDCDDLCLVRHYECYDGCEFCQTHDYCKFEGE